jgi:hypothetical protein
MLDYDRIENAARSALGTAVFDTAYAEGAATTIDTVGDLVGHPRERSDGAA